MAEEQTVQKTNDGNEERMFVNNFLRKVEITPQHTENLTMADE